MRIGNVALVAFRAGEALLLKLPGPSVSPGFPAGHLALASRMMTIFLSLYSATLPHRVVQALEFLPRLHARA